MYSRKWTQLAVTACAVIFIVAGSLLIISGRELPSVARTQTDEPLEAIKQEFEKTRDPLLNVIPRGRLTRALAYYAAQASEGRKMKTTNGFPTVTWTERGPNNIGGRTRALIYDANDLTLKTVYAGSVGGGVWKCTDITAAALAWTPVSDQFSNLAVTAIAQDPSNPQIMYFGTGEGWGNSDAIKGNGIWKSTNGGSSWSQLSATNNNNDFAYIQKIVVAGNGDVYAACKGATNLTGGLQKSTNGGTSWTRVIGTGATDMHISDIEVASNGDLYAATGIFSTGKIYKSSYATHTTNVGNSGNWTNITPTGTWQRIEIAVAPSNSSQIYAVCQGTLYEVTGIYSSTNGGINWTSKTIPNIYDQGANSVFTRNQSWYDLMCVADPNISTTVYLGGVDILKSANSGTTWTQLSSWSLYDDGSFFPNPFPWATAQNVHADIHTLCFKPGSSSTAVVGCDGGMYYSDNLNTGIGLPSWDNKNLGYNVTQYYSCATHPTNSNYFLAGAQDNGTHQFSTSGVNSVVEVTGGDGGFCLIDKLNGANQVAAYVYNNYYYSTNNGAFFSYIAVSDNSGRFINPCDLDPVNDVMYSAGGTNELMVWHDMFSNVTYRNDLTLSLNGEQVSAVKVSPNNATTVYLGTGNGRIYRLSNTLTTPTLTNLTPTPLVSNAYVSCIDIVKRSTNTDDSIVISMSNYGINSVYYTSNGTSSTPTWVDIDDNNTLQDIPVRWCMWSPADSRIILLGTEVGVIGTGTIAGNSTNWTIVNNNMLPNVRVDMIRANSNSQLVAATHGRGLWTSSNISPLDLQLLSFDARLSGGKVALEWKVSGDDEAGKYVVERAYQGGAFAPLQTVFPLGKESYQVFDAGFDRNANLINYRLRMEEQNGNVQYSEVRTIRLRQQTVVFIDKVFPTVSSGLVNIFAGNAGLQQMRVQLIDALGRIHLDKLMPYANQTLNLNRLSRGNYLVFITDEQAREKHYSRIHLK